MTDLCKTAVGIFACPGARLLSEALLPPPSPGNGEEEEYITLEKKAKEKNLSQLFLAAGIYLIRTGN